jgi:hypothetical protein
MVDEIKARFRASGIPIFVEPDYAARDTMSVGPASTYRNATTPPESFRVYVCLEQQREEAKRLFHDARYKVKAPVDVEQFEATMERLGANRKFEWPISLNWIVGIVAVAAVLWIARRLVVGP